MKRNMQDVDASKMVNSKRPKAPWGDAESKKLFQQSQVDGHRKVTLKCTECGLEFSVMTWRNGKPQEVAPHFTYCPECGTQGKLGLLAFDHEIGEIFRASETS